MAKRKKKRHSTDRRVGRASSKKEAGSTMLGTVLGLVAGRVLKNTVGAKIDPKILGIVQAVGGGVLAMKMKNPLAEGVGYGLVANGALTLGQAFNIPLLSGAIGAPITFDTPRKVGQFRDEVKKVGQTANPASNFPTPARVQGMTNMENAYRAVYGLS